jgi:hypothetical protein
MRFGQTPAGYSAARVVRFRTDSRGTLDYILTNSDLREAPGSQGSTRAVPIRSLLRLVNAEEQEEGRVFGREEIAAITAAFKQLLLDFKLVDRDDAVVTMLAKLVIELARNGERDPERLRAAVLKGLSL